jgi:hypothetical protein
MLNLKNALSAAPRSCHCYPTAGMLAPSIECPNQFIVRTEVGDHDVRSPISINQPPVIRFDQVNVFHFVFGLVPLPIAVVGIVDHHKSARLNRVANVSVNELIGRIIIVRQRNGVSSERSWEIKVRLNDRSNQAFVKQ